MIPWKPVSSGHKAGQRPSLPPGGRFCNVTSHCKVRLFTPAPKLITVFRAHPGSGVALSTSQGDQSWI